MIRNKKFNLGRRIYRNKLAKYFAGKGNHILGLRCLLKNKFLTDSIICDITSMKF